MSAQPDRIYRRAVSFLSWQEWVAVALVLVAPYVIHWWSLLLVPVILPLVLWGSSRRLDG